MEIVAAPSEAQPSGFFPLCTGAGATNRPGALVWGVFMAHLRGAKVFSYYAVCHFCQSNHARK